MKHNYAQKWTVYDLSAIQKRHFFEKSPFLFFYSAIFAHFLPKTDFCHPTTFSYSTKTVRFGEEFVKYMICDQIIEV